MITVEVADPRSTESLFLVEKLSLELTTITGDSGTSHFNIDSMDVGGGLWVLARGEYRRPIGCGAIRPLTPKIAELKRIFSDRSIPGIGNALLNYLETWARNKGYSEIWLETRHINLRAVRFYENNGFKRMDNYGPYVGREEAACFAKSIIFSKSNSL